MARWFKVPANFYRDENYKHLTNAELAGLFKLMAWSMDNHRDGEVDQCTFRELGVHRRVRDSLLEKGLLFSLSSPGVDVALLRGRSGHFRITGWEQLQTSEKDLERARLARSEAGRRMVSARWNKH